MGLNMKNFQRPELFGSAMGCGDKEYVPHHLGCVSKLTDDLGKVSGYPRPAGFLVFLRLCHFRHHLLVLVI